MAVCLCLPALKPRTPLSRGTCGTTHIFSWSGLVGEVSYSGDRILVVSGSGIGLLLQQEQEKNVFSAFTDFLS